MDLQKDNTNLIKFIEHQPEKTNPFAENRVGERAYRRSERIAAAIFLLTNHVPTEEILRLKARTLATDLLTEVLSLLDEMRATNSDRARVFKATIRELISHMRLLSVAGYISSQNVESVTEALDELPAFLATSQRSNLSESVSVNRDDLIDVRDVGVRNIPRVSEEKLKKDITDTSNRTHRGENRESASSSESVAEQSNKLTLRSQAILEVLRTGGELAIRDIASNLPEYSEKMIQRELAELVEKGRVKKVGMKRWSRYSI
jgi:hypothetical protein